WRFRWEKRRTRGMVTSLQRISCDRLDGRGDAVLVWDETSLLGLVQGVVPLPPDQADCFPGEVPGRLLFLHSSAQVLQNLQFIGSEHVFYSSRLPSSKEVVEHLLFLNIPVRPHIYGVGPGK